MTNSQIKVYYDGLCLLCSKEINHYKTMSGSDRIHFIDITSGAFDAVRESLDPKAIHKELHTRDAEGQIHIGVDAFILIWSKLHKLEKVSLLARRKPFKNLLNLFYAGFVQIRPWLPRRECAESPYCEIPKKTL